MCEGVGTSSLRRGFADEETIVAWTGGVALDCFATLVMTGEKPLEKNPFVYIVTNKRNGALYTGVTSNLPARIHQHREGLVSGFTKRYGCKLLVWFEQHEMMEAAILREKQIKAGSRKKKLKLIEDQNPSWRDLYPELF